MITLPPISDNGHMFCAGKNMKLNIVNKAIIVFVSCGILGGQSFSIGNLADDRP